MGIIAKIFGQKKAYVCGGNHCIQFTNADTKATSEIFYREPTGGEKLEFLYTMLECDQSNLKALTDSEKLLSKLHEIALIQKFIPFAKRIITDVKGYYTSDNKETKDLELIGKYWPNHLQNVALIAFQLQDNFKKKH